MDAILYTSNTGYTGTYAKMLAGRLGIPVYPLRSAEAARLPKSAEIIYLGWIMAGAIRGAEKAAKRYHIRLLCGVGLAAPDEKLLSELRTRHQAFCPEISYLRGGFDMDRLHGGYRLLMKMMRSSLEKRTGRTPEEDTLLCAMKNGENFITGAALDEIAACPAIRQRAAGRVCPV